MPRRIYDNAKTRKRANLFVCAGQSVRRQGLVILPSLPFPANRFSRQFEHARAVRSLSSAVTVAAGFSPPLDRSDREKQQSPQVRQIAGSGARGSSMSMEDVKALEHELEKLRAENRELRSQLMQAQKLSSVGSLASSITHEFNNILTTIINYAKMGLRHKDVGTREKAFDKILSAGHRASKITTGMLSYARAQGERREATDLVALVEDVLMLVEKDLQMHRVRLATNFVGHPFAIVNANQIQQVILNLVVNARQAMDNGGNLYIAVRPFEETGTVEVSVRDTGCGIPGDKLREIFEPFYTTKVADQHGQGGTGLGLSLCRDIIEAHKGRIRVDSALGKGTTFTLKFALAQAPTLISTSAPVAAGKLAD
jgi:signal transduction histidine kinase